MAKELELKLEIPLASAEALAAALAVQDAHEPDAACETTLHAVYFDTPDCLLRRRDLSLRIRTTNGGAVQTVKSSGVAAGLFDRDEWELPVDAPGSAWRPLPDDRTPLASVLARRIAELAPAFTVDTLRRSLRLTESGAIVELAFDRVEIRAGDRSMRFSEIEIELVSGSSAALFDYARRLGAAAPMRIGVLSKAERGYALREALPTAHRADALTLDRGADLAAAFAAIAASCIRQYRLNESILLDHYQVKALHQARVAIRRLRSALAIFKHVVGGDTRDRFNGGLRELAQSLGEARDLDILAEQAGPGPMIATIEAARDQARAAAIARLEAAQTRALLLDLSEWIACGAWRADPATAELRATPLPDFAAAALDRMRRKIAKHGRGLDAINAEARHQVRKDAKRLRYGVEFFASLYASDRAAKRGRKFRKALEKLLDALGGLNDREAAQFRLGDLGLASAEGADALLAKWNAEDLLDHAVSARARLLATDPFWR